MSSQKLNCCVAMEDGSVFVDNLPTGQGLYVAPTDMCSETGERLKLKFNERAAYAAKANANNYLGHDDWFDASLEALDACFYLQDTGALKDTFDECSYYGSSDVESENTMMARAFAAAFTVDNMSKFSTLHGRLARLGPAQS